MIAPTLITTQQRFYLRNRRCKCWIVSEENGKSIKTCSEQFNDKFQRGKKACRKDKSFSIEEQVESPDFQFEAWPEEILDLNISRWQVESRPQKLRNDNELSYWWEAELHDDEDEG